MSMPLALMIKPRLAAALQKGMTVIQDVPHAAGIAPDTFHSKSGSRTHALDLHMLQSRSCCMALES